MSRPTPGTWPQWIAAFLALSGVALVVLQLYVARGLASEVDLREVKADVSSVDRRVIALEQSTRAAEALVTSTSALVTQVAVLASRVESLERQIRASARAQ